MQLKVANDIVTKPNNKLRRLITVGLIVFLSLPLLFAVAAPSQPAYAQTVPQIGATAAIAVDVTTGRVLYNKNMHRRLAMASTTKIMTALTALSIEGVRLDELYTVVKDDLVGEASMGLRLDEKVTFEALLYGLMLNSGNDAAMAIARYAGGKLPGDVSALTRFMARMNQYAPELGMRNTRFANPHGLDAAEHYSSAYDLSIAGWYALKHPVLSQIVAQPSKNIAGRTLRNLNPLFASKRYEGVNGIKPGMTDNAGLCLAASAVRNGQMIIAVTLNNAPADYGTDSQKLLNYGFARVATPDFMASVGQGASEINPDDYIGRPQGNRLIPAAPIQAVAPPPLPVSVNTGGVFNPVVQIYGQNGATNGVSNPVLIAPGANPGGTTNFEIVGQIGTPSGTPGQTTPGPNSPGGNDGNNQSGGGINFIGIILVLLIAVGVLYAILRFTGAGGDRGRDIAYKMEDVAYAATEGVKTGGQKLFNLVRPGNHTDDHAPSRNQLPNRYGQLEPADSDDDEEEEPPARPNIARPRPQVNPNDSLSAYNTKPELGRSRPVQNQPETPAVRPVNRAQNPLANFFDDDNEDNEQNQERPAVAPKISSFTRQPQPATEQDDDSPLPPQPLTARRIEPVEPVAPPPVRERQPERAPEPQREWQQPQPENRPAAPRPPQPITPPAPVINPNRPAANGASADIGNYVRPAAPQSQPQPVQAQPTAPAVRPSSGTNYDALIIQAKRAIDYAHAGRIVASTQEFRRVVETQPLFDFGSLEEFQHMPVVGFKALANAYKDAGHGMYAVLLLDMGIEQYPNDLELRSMLRNIRREMGL